MRIALAAIATVAALSAAQAGDLSCPASVEGDDVTDASQASFRHVSFFDGDPAELADLAPEDSSSATTLDQRWRLVRSDNRPITMVCRYHGTERTVQKEVPADVKECRLHGFMDSAGEIIGSPTLSCD